ncbi:hypothetical protein BVX98_01565 [bacterium F11]|nr:hypothetical protein BVX98_01565 [bacterium F11]
MSRQKMLKAAMIIFLAFLFLLPVLKAKPSLSTTQISNIKLLYREAVIDYLNGHHEKATSTLKGILRLNPEHTNARRLLLKVMVKNSAPPQKKIINRNDSWGTPKTIPKKAPSPPQHQFRQQNQNKLKVKQYTQNLPIKKIKREPPSKKSTSPTKSFKSKIARSDSNGNAFPSTMKQDKSPLLMIPLQPWFIVGFLLLLGFNIGFLVILEQRRHLKALTKENMHLSKEVEKEKSELLSYKRYLESEKESQRKAEELRKSRLEEDKKRKENEKQKDELTIIDRKQEKPFFHKSKSLPSPSQKPLASPSQPVTLSISPKSVIGVTIDVPSIKNQEYRERIADESIHFFESFPSNAMSHLSQLANDKNALARASIILALEKIGSPEALQILFRLCEDVNPDVRRESLKSLKMIQRNKKDSLPETTLKKIRDILAKEVSKGEWVI